MRCFVKSVEEFFWGVHTVKKCDICGTSMLHVPEKYIKETEILTDKQIRERVNEPNGLYEELVKTSPEFDQYLFDYRDEILAKSQQNSKLKWLTAKQSLKEKIKVIPTEWHALIVMQLILRKYLLQAE